MVATSRAGRPRRRWRDPGGRGQPSASGTDRGLGDDAELGRVAGLDESGSLAIYGPLIEGTLGNARALGIQAALTGPMTRGDIGTLRSHLAALGAHAPRVLPLYIAAAQPESELAMARGA